jgi:hypothetical protein
VLVWVAANAFVIALAAESRADADTMFDRLRPRA